MVGPATLRLFGVLHMDSLDKVTGELEPYVAESDAVFIEYPETKPGVWTYLQLVARAPVVFVGNMLVGLLLHYPLYVLFNRDILPTELVAAKRLQEEYDRPLHAIDEHPVFALSSAGPKTILWNWSVLAVVLWLDPVTALVTAAVSTASVVVPGIVRRAGQRSLAVVIFVAGYGLSWWTVFVGLYSLWLVLVGVLVWMVLVVRTVGHRNDVMLDRVTSISAVEGYDEPVLITGRSHLGGLAREAGERGLDVVAAHVSMWRDEGVTHDNVVPEALPEIGTNGDADDRTPALGSERAVLGRRLGAIGVDAVLVGVLASLGLVPASMLLAGLGGGGWSTVPASIALSGVASTVSYWALFEGASGRTVGKRQVGLAVADGDAEPISPTAAVVRNLVRPVDALLLYLPGVFTIFLSKRSQRLGDLLAGTVVGKRSTDEVVDPHPRSTASDGAAGTTG